MPDSAPIRISELPLPLRLRNALTKAGFSTEVDILAWHAAGANIIDGVGETGRNQLIGWLIKEEPRLRELHADVAAVKPATDEGPVGRWGRAAADTSMRGGLESLANYQPAATKPIKPAENIKSADEHDPYWTPTRRSHQWDAPESYEASLAAKLNAQRAAISKIGGQTTVSTSKDALSLTLENEILKRLDDLMPVISSLPHAKEFGIVVDRKIVARMALIRGLDALERAHNTKNDASKAENAPENASDAPVSAAEPPSGVHATPEGWTKCGPTDKIPVAQAVIHDYYTQNNWFRYWGKAGDSVIYFYWSPEVQFQDLDVFPGTDKNGKTVAVQETPWGPGHIIPMNWANQ